MPDIDEKYSQAKQIIQTWVEQGHNRCWYYPDLFNQLVEIFEIQATCHPNLPSLNEFREGCAKYQQQEFNLGDSRQE